MIRIVTTLACAIGLSACATLPDWAVAPAFLNSDTAADAGHYSFDWQLSGERQLAPLQVFDNGNKTWLQFMPGQIVPAIFRRTQSGEQPLSYTRRGDYLVTDGVWPELSFRGGSARAVARKKAEPDVVDVPGIDPQVDSVSEPFAVETPAVTNNQEAPEPILHKATKLVVDSSAPKQRSSTVTDDVQHFTRASFETLDPVPLLTPSDALVVQDDKPVVSYGITLQDKNMRRALHRWAVLANWAFEPEHWAVDVDIPVSGEALFAGSFQDAVQDLLSATELSERPLRPCFYSNRVLRVVSYAQSCDRSGGGRES